MIVVMPVRHKLLILDDDQDVLELYREMLAHLPSQPDVHTATSGARAIALLESEPFTLLLSDLKMPKMDGLQVLAIVRRKFPQLRTAVITSVADEQFRARAYAMGVDLFVEKPSTGKEIIFFLDYIESLLGREVAGGFRGCKARASSISSNWSVFLRVRPSSRSPTACWRVKSGFKTERPSMRPWKTWPAKRLFKNPSWKTGNFEILAAEPAANGPFSTPIRGCCWKRRKPWTKPRRRKAGPSRLRSRRRGQRTRFVPWRRWPGFMAWNSCWPRVRARKRRWIPGAWKIRTRSPILWARPWRAFARSVSGCKWGN